MGKRENQNVVDAFHAHLDECAQCREHPFDLCPRGRQRIAKVFHPAAAAPRPDAGGAE